MLRTSNDALPQPCHHGLVIAAVTLRHGAANDELEMHSLTPIGRITPAGSTAYSCLQKTRRTDRGYRRRSQVCRRVARGAEVVELLDEVGALGAGLESPVRPPAPPRQALRPLLGVRGLPFNQLKWYLPLWIRICLSSHWIVNALHIVWQSTGWKGTLVSASGSMKI